MAEPYTEADLTAWAAAHPAMPQAVAVLTLIRERDRLRADVARLEAECGALIAERDRVNALNVGLAHRCAGQSELLSARAERVQPDSGTQD